MTRWTFTPEGHWCVDRAAEAALRAVLPLGAAPIRPDPRQGVVHQLFQVGEHALLRLSRADPAWHGAVRAEPLLVPLARAAGVSTPELLGWAGPEHGLPVLTTLVERCPGADLFRCDLPNLDRPAIYRALGADLARLHRAAVPADVRPQLERTEGESLGEALKLAAGYDLIPGFTHSTWRAWESQLVTAWAAPLTEVLVHHDVHEGNVMVSPDGDYAGLIDWGDGGWGDPAQDFVAMDGPGLVPALEGYVEAGGDVTSAFRGRIVAGQLAIALRDALIRPAPAELRYPLGRLFGSLRFWATAGPEWDPWRPPTAF